MYWKFQGYFDAVVGILLTVLLWAIPHYGGPILFAVNFEETAIIARTWVGPILTLLGMMSATTAFIFSVVDRPEFRVLKKSTSEAYLWNIFSENLLWLAIAAFGACAASFGARPLPEWLLYGLNYILIMVCICITKFVWVIRQIISVRISTANQK